jgi:hypothetical protein
LFNNTFELDAIGSRMSDKATTSWKLERLRIYDGEKVSDGCAFAVMRYYTADKMKKQVIFIRDIQMPQFYLSWKIINLDI